MTLYCVPGLESGPDLQPSERESDRAFTHAIVGRRDLAKARQIYTTAETAAKFGATWMTYRAAVDAGVGKTWTDPAPGGVSTVVTQEQFDKASAILKDFPSPGEFARHAQSKAIATIDRFSTAAAGPLEVLQWSASEANARKGLKRCAQWHTDLRVVPVEVKVASDV